MNRTALITGASAGLGAEFARQLAATGHRLVLVARRIDRLTMLAEELSAEHGTPVACWAIDLSQPGAPDTIVERLAAEDITVDYLVNNAGSAGPDLLDERDWDRTRGFVQLMATSAAHLCHLLIPPMSERGFGRVINVSSVAGLMRLPTSGHYGPLKAYLIDLSLHLSVKVRAQGVHVSALCPGFVHTEFHDTPELAKMKASSPDFLWYDARTVVADGILGVERGKALVVSGRLYRWTLPILRGRLLRWLVTRRSR